MRSVKMAYETEEKAEISEGVLTCEPVMHAVIRRQAATEVTNMMINVGRLNGRRRRNQQQHQLSKAMA